MLVVDADDEKYQLASSSLVIALMVMRQAAGCHSRWHLFLCFFVCVLLLLLSLSLPSLSFFCSVPSFVSSPGAGGGKITQYDYQSLGVHGHYYYLLLRVHFVSSLTHSLMFLLNASRVADQRQSLTCKSH